MADSKDNIFGNFNYNDYAGTNSYDYGYDPYYPYDYGYYPYYPYYHVLSLLSLLF